MSVNHMRRNSVTIPALQHIHAAGMICSSPLIFIATKNLLDALLDAPLNRFYVANRIHGSEQDVPAAA